MTNEKESKRMGERIAKLRAERGLTQTELAERAGIQRSHLVRIEQGVYDIRLSVLSALAEALDNSVELTEN